MRTPPLDALGVVALALDSITDDQRDNFMGWADLTRSMEVEWTAYRSTTQPGKTFVIAGARLDVLSTGSAFS